MADYYINKTAARIDFLLEKVEGIEDGAEVNQNAISSVTANGVTIVSDSKTDAIEVAAGSNVTVVADASNKILTISAVDTTYSDATTSASGLMSAADKTKLNAIESGAEVNVQSDWNQTNTGSDDYIKNKPSVYTQSETDILLSAKADSSSLSTVATSGSYSDLTNTPIIDTALANSTNAIQNKAVYDKFVTVDADIAALRLALDAEVYGFRIDKQDSNPETRVEYLYDAVGMTPARMNYTTGQFDYGSWGNAWFITGNKPCALKYDGTVDYYLDPDDYTKKADGTASDVSDSSYAGNFMASMPTVWIKRWEDARYQYIAIANKQIDDDLKAYAHDAGDGTINPMIYLPMFKGVVVDSKLRSIAGQYPTGMTTAAEDKTAAEANGSGWQTWDWSKHCLITDLLTLISKSTNSQAVFGNGDVSTYDAESPTYGLLMSGDGDLTTGQFYGTNDFTHHVKVFHIEDYWGSRWDRCLGLNRINSYYSVKPVRPYSVNGDSSYTQLGLVPNIGWNYYKTLTVNEFGCFPSEGGGSATTYYCDGINTGNVNTNSLALFGSDAQSNTAAGAYALHISRPSSNTLWFFGGSVCYNAPHSS